MKIVILTASTMKKTIEGRTYSGKCITGYDLNTNRVVRLVQNESGAPIENPYCNRFQPLNVYDIQINGSCPVLCQVENVLSNYRNARWLGYYEAGIYDLYQKYQRINYGDSSFMMDGSYKLEDISTLKHSLEIIKVSNLQLFKDERNKTKCSFSYLGRKYIFLRVTDPDYLEIEKDYLFKEAFLAVSIPSDDWGGSGYYKFVAAIYPLT